MSRRPNTHPSRREIGTPTPSRQARSFISNAWLCGWAGRGKVVFGVQVHTQGKPAFRCSWNPVDADYVLSTSSDGFAAVLCVSRQAVERTYRHPAPVFGCDWHKADGRLFATGCQDSVVRVFDRTQDGCLHQLRGHGAKSASAARSWGRSSPRSRSARATCSRWLEL